MDVNATMGGTAKLCRRVDHAAGILLRHTRKNSLSHENGRDLIAIHMAVNVLHKKSHKYPHTFYGTEEVSSTLADVCSAALYA